MTNSRCFAFYKVEDNGPESSPRRLIRKEEVNHVISLAEEANMRFCLRVVSQEEARTIEAKLKKGYES